jgi:hypothetical protein
LDRRLGGPQSRSGRCGKEKIPSPAYKSRMIINDELEWTWKEAVVAYLRNCLSIFLELLRKSKRIWQISESLGRNFVEVSFSKYLSWQAMNFLERSTHFSKM